MKLKDIIPIMFTEEVHIDEMFYNKDDGHFVTNKVIYEESFGLGKHSIDETKIDPKYLDRYIDRLSRDRTYNRIWIELETRI